jgi:hypothetical protein
MGAHARGKEVGDAKARPLYFAITPDIIDALGWPINADREDRRMTHVSVHEGVGDDAGFLLVVLDTERGYALGTNGEHANSFSMNITTSRLQHYKVDQGVHSIRPVDYTLDEKEKVLLIECPQWLRYDPMSYTPPRKEPAPRPTQRRVDAETPSDDPDALHLNRKQRRVAARSVAKLL